LNCGERWEDRLKAVYSSFRSYIEINLSRIDFFT